MTIATRISDAYTKHRPADDTEQSVCTVILEFEVLTGYSVAVLQQLMAVTQNLLTQTETVETPVEEAGDTVSTFGEEEPVRQNPKHFPDEELMTEEDFLNLNSASQEFGE